MVFPGLSINITCDQCGQNFRVDVEGTEPEYLPKPGGRPLRKKVEYLCPKCGHRGEMEVQLAVPGEG